MSYQETSALSGRAQRATSSASSNARTGVQLAARIGYGAKGFVYGTVGVLATMTAFGFSGGQVTGTRGAITTLQSQPFGQFLLWAIVAGLAGFVIWRFTQAFADPEQLGDDAKGRLRRTGLFISGITYGALAVFTLGRLVSGVPGTGGPSGSSGSSGSDAAAQIMEFSWGIWIVGAIGVVFFLVGAWQLVRAWRATFRKHWDTGSMAPKTERWMTRLSRVGIVARAIVFGLIGWFFLQAAMNANPDQAGSLGDALRSFADGPFGTVWLAAIGIGFIAFGVYCLVNARYRRIPV
jgi:hypothetical protein